MVQFGLRRGRENKQAEVSVKAPEEPLPASPPKADDTKEQGANGGAQAPTGMSPRDVRRMRLSENFSQVVAVMMRDPNFRKVAVGDLEWLVLPPLIAGQFRLAHMPAQPSLGNQDQSMLVPVAVALWARVSDAIDRALSEKLDEQMILPADKWASGNNIWLMAVAGDPRAIPTFLKKLETEEFKGQEIKFRRRGPDGKISVVRLGGAAKDA